MKSNRLFSRSSFIKKASLTIFSLSAFTISSFGRALAKGENQGDELPSDSTVDDFEFYVGKWTIRNKKLKSPFSNSTEWYEFDATEEIERRLGGLGYVGKYKTLMEGKPFEGLAIHLFDAKTKLWSNWWADSFRGTMDPPVIGSFENNIGKFYAKDTFKGKPIDLMFHWDVSDKDNPIWSQAFSSDDGKTWETNWYMYYHRVK